ncbi:MAG: PKD domain-containing protein [Planctomycetota bacterium]
MAFLVGVMLLGLPAIARAAAGPDLVFSAFSAKVSSGKVSISNTFKNQGTVATAGTFYGAFYLSTDNVLEPLTDVFLGTRERTSVLDVGATSGATSAFAVPASVVAGDYYVFGVVDSTSTQAESNEANNIAVAAGTIAIKADLIVSSLSASRTGMTLAVKDTVKNQGPLSAKGPFRVDFYLSADATITSSDVLLGSRNVTATLAYNATNQATTTFAIPAGLAAGSWRVGAIADGGNAVPETDESNNTKASSALSLLPDFVAVSVTASASGRTVTVTETVRNDGPVASPVSKMDLRLSTDNSIGSSDPVLAQRAIPSLAPGEASTATTIATAPAAVVNGAYYVGVWADAAGTIAELSDSNNKLASSATVTLTNPPPANVPPVANASANPTAGIAPLAVSFSGSASTDSDGTIVSYAWVFGDGQTGTGATASHTYASAGTYAATLTVTDDDGATGTNGVTIVVSEPPPSNVPPVANASASPTTGTAPLAVSFSGSASTDSDGTIVSYAWSFGDGQTGSGATVSHTYASAGTYTATLTVTDDDGATGIATCVVTVTAPPGEPVLDVSVAAVDFGSLDRDMVKYTEAFDSERLVEIRNTGGADLNVTAAVTVNSLAFKIPFGATVPTLAPGERYFLAVKFEPRRLYNEAVPPAQPWNGTLTLGGNGGSKTVVLSARTVDGVTGGASPLLMNWGYARPSAAVVDFGSVDVEQTVVESQIANQGDASLAFSGAEIVGDDAANFRVSIQPSGLVLQPGTHGGDAWYSPSGFSPLPPAGQISVTFAPQTMEPVSRRLTAKLVVHTSAGDLEVGLMGVGLYRKRFQVGETVFEFDRVNAGQSTRYLGTDGSADFYSLADLVVENLGREPLTVTVNALESLSPGGAARFGVTNVGTRVLGPGNPSVTLAATFSPDVNGHFSARLKIDSTDPASPVKSFLLHGATTGANLLGTASTLYTYDDIVFYSDDYDWTRMIRLRSTGNAVDFGDLYERQDPFLRTSADNHVDLESWSYEHESTVLFGDAAYVLDSDVFGPYTPGDPENKAATEIRLLAGNPIGKGGILKNSDFVLFDTGFADIRAEGTCPLRIDVANDSRIFYTEALNEGGVVRTRLKFRYGSSGNGVVENDLSTRLAGVPGKEVVALRVIQGGSAAYRAFVIFQGGDTYDMDLDASCAVVATKRLTPGLSALPGAGARIDSSGRWITATSAPEGAGSARLQVWREDLHAGGKALLGEAVVPFADTVTNLLVDKTGYVLLETSNGIYAFSPAGQPQGYVLSGLMLYSSNEIGSNPDGIKRAYWFVDFNQMWFEH